MTADHSPLYPRNIPAAADFEARARSVGVNNDSHLVLYDQCPSGNGFFIGGRAWWTFKVSAHPRSNTQIIPRGGGGGGEVMGSLVQRLNLPGWKVGDHGFEPHSGLQNLKETKKFFPAHS